jgi:hypothetical protein
MEGVLPQNLVLISECKTLIVSRFTLSLNKKEKRGKRLSETWTMTTRNIK